VTPRAGVFEGMTGHAAAQSKARVASVPTVAILLKRLVRSRRDGVAGHAVIRLVAGGTPRSTHRSLTPMGFVAPSEHVIAGPHHIVTLKAGISWLAAETSVAKTAVRIVAGGLFPVIGAEVDTVSLRKIAGSQVTARCLAPLHALVADLAAIDTNVFGRAARILVTLSAHLHLRQAHVGDVLGANRVGMAGGTGNGVPHGIELVIRVGEVELLGNHASPDCRTRSRPFALPFQVALGTLAHQRLPRGLVVVATTALRMTRQGYFSLLVASVAIGAGHMKTYNLLHSLDVEMRLVSKVRCHHPLVAAAREGPHLCRGGSGDINRFVAHLAKFAWAFEELALMAAIAGSVVA
jgi:hypothetical protein